MIILKQHFTYLTPDCTGISKPYPLRLSRPPCWLDWPRQREPVMKFVALESSGANLEPKKGVQDRGPGFLGNMPSVFHYPKSWPRTYVRGEHGLLNRSVAEEASV